MIVVTVTEHESIEPGRVNTYEVGIVDQRLWGEPEIHEDIASFRTASRLGVHREAELTDQRPAGRFVAANPPAKMLDIDIGKLPARRYSELVAGTATLSSSGTEPEIASAFTGFELPISVATMALNMAAPPPHITSRRCISLHRHINMVKSSLFAWALRTSYPRPTNGIAACCARAASGHTAAPPRRAMNSRLL